ncbi:MAG: zinc ribbon domain-containing protein [Ardenticatenaceae bacterium]|nr:zinc ribbon domain-containing protein [Ardenticatenaceae bacterium]
METSNKCPHCESTDNPPNARYCVNCRGQLFQVCPSCLSELPWHFENCPKCGVNIDEFKEQTKIAQTEKRDNELEIYQRELSQVQNDLQFVQSPPLSAYISTYSKSQKRFRDLGKTSIWGCGMGVFDLFIVFRLLQCLSARSF